MVRFILSIIILTLLITYAIIPFVKYLEKFFKKEAKRIDKSLNDNKIKKDDVK
ncbi:hypothetical protein [Bacillus wiedmannii]|uniref:hypothetical protein n=1 Tax=Bacillus wiedmannii TaxID=1890302 RepID=UPI001482FE4F|nr:hypothetical protein [Bacillus wiedmannii]